MNRVATVVVPTSPRRVDMPGSVDNVDLKTMGGRIAWSRLRRGMTQQELSKLTGKSRATIVQYEQNNIQPPITEVEKLAGKLDVSPEFLAFGRHGIDALSNAALEVVTITELVEGRDGLYEAGQFAVPRNFFGDRDIDLSKFAFYVLNHDADALGYRKGDRLLIDKSQTEFSTEHDIYLVRNDVGASVIRREFHVASKGGKATITNGRGTQLQVSPKELDIIGAIVGCLSLSI